MESLVLYFFILPIFVFYAATYISLSYILSNCCKINVVPILGIFCTILMNLTDHEVETFFETNALENRCAKDKNT